MAREELAPSVVGGLLVSYRLEGELRGAPSTEGRTASGYEGSIMEPCTRATLGTLGDLREMMSWLLGFFPWLT